MSLAPHGGTTAKKAGKLQRKYKFQAAKYKLSGFSSYKDGTFRIIFRDSRKKITKSVPLDKTDLRNYRSDMKIREKKRLINKYIKRIQ